MAFLSWPPRIGQELTAPIEAASKGISPESLAASAREPAGKRPQRLTEQVAEHLRVHMSFTQKARSLSDP